MRTIKLVSLEIENFKGVAHRVIRPAGGNLAVFGKNGTGKTTHYDALCWLLFGKDSHGNMPDTPDFEIKPRGSSGTGVMPTVTGVLDVDGREMILRKVYSENWTKRRGSTEAVFSGNTTDCFIDDVPRKVGEYAGMIGTIVDEQQFLMLTNVYRFARDIPWKDRRALLFELCSAKSDAELLALDPHFEDLTDSLGNLSVDDFKTAQKSKRRSINDELEKLPTRIDECDKIVNDLSSINFDALQLELSEREADRDRLKGELVQLDNDTALAAARNRVSELKNDLQALSNENDSHRRSQMVPIVDPREHVQRELDAVLRQRKELSDQADRARGENDMASLRLDEYRKRWKAIGAERFTEDVCPTCGQQLPADKLEAAQKKFSDSQKARQNALLKDSELLKDGIRTREQLLAEITPKLDNLTERENELLAKLEDMAAPEAPVIEDFPGYATSAAKLRAAIDDAENHLSEIVAGGTERRHTLQKQIATLDGQLANIRDGLAKKNILEQTQARKQSHQESQRTLAAQLEQIDRLVDLCEAFTRFKTDSLTVAVNEKFRGGVSFRLFREQQNGGLADCCDVMVDGKPYGTISDGEKVKAGLSIIETLSEHFGVQVPLFVDGAESVTDFPDMNTQVVRLVVSEEDKELRYLA